MANVNLFNLYAINGMLKHKLERARCCGNCSLLDCRDECVGQDADCKQHKYEWEVNDEVAIHNS